MCFVKGIKGHHNYISIAMKRYFVVKETKRLQESSPPLHEETTQCPF